VLSLPGAVRDQIELAMREAVVTPDPYLTEIASHLIIAGGKRLRPMLTVVAFQTGGQPISGDAVSGGVACELVHLGSLYHDDVMDDASTRRGVETVNAKWGNLQAILAGDFLLSRASEIAASLGTEIAALLARTIGRLCEGQIEELRHTYDPSRTEASYFSSIEGKTASLFATAARIGGRLAGLGDHQVDALTEYGNNFGMVFQIVDDVLDITATDEQLGKPAGHDLVEGVYTLPVLRVLADGSDGADELRALLGGPLDLAGRDRALAIVRQNEVIAGAVATAEEFARKAAGALSVLPDTPATEALCAAPLDLLETLGAAQLS
jgi:heptaprenyl diphosphate synthase